ncbi:MAG: c-type cytochrome [Planctomycetota bacterium]
MDPSITAILGVVWLLVGGAAVALMLNIFGRNVPTSGRNKAAKIHRALGWTYVGIYGFFLYVMVRKSLGYTEFNSLQVMHFTLAISIAPLLTIKILIVRRYPKLHSMLPGLGLTVYTLSFVLILLGVGPFLINKLNAPDVEDKSDTEIVALGGQLLEQRCQKCHELDRVYDQKGRKSAELWTSTVDRMVKLEPPLADVRDPILMFLQAEFVAPDTPEGVMLTGAALVEGRCQKCHTLDRVFQYTKTHDQWRATVKRYSELLPDHIRPDEIEPIAQFLFEKRGQPESEEDKKRKVFEARCAACHNLSRALDHARDNELSPRRWRRVLKKMKRIAAEREVETWSDEERDTIAEYLSAQYQDEPAPEDD